ncbi:unnamed protein product [Rhizophagus irregularis]|nr:unnamed protein product [Rhizophagus irregularis]
MSPNDQLHFEQLLLHLIVSNGLPFTFVENEETIVIFQFIVPGIKLPKRKAIAEKVLKKSSEMLQENIIKIAKNDPDGVTATFDGWTNVKQEHLWEIFLSAKFNDDRTNVTRNNGVSNIPANKKTTNQNGGRKLPDDIADIINDSEFWTTLFELQNLLYPLCGFFNKLQKDTARLHEVLHCFAYTTKIFGYHNDPKFSSKMFRSSTSNLTWTHIGQWLKFYFESWFNSKPKSILAELIKYKREEDPYDMDSFNQFKGNLVDFWESTSGIGPELARVAVQIHGICVNSASVERLWSSIGYLHTNRRNRLQVFFFYYFSFI